MGGVVLGSMRLKSKMALGAIFYGTDCSARIWVPVRDFHTTDCTGSLNA